MLYTSHFWSGGIKILKHVHCEQIYKYNVDSVTEQHLPMLVTNVPKHGQWHKHVRSTLTFELRKQYTLHTFATNFRPLNFNRSLTGTTLWLWHNLNRQMAEQTVWYKSLFFGHKTLYLLNFFRNKFFLWTAYFLCSLIPHMHIHSNYFATTSILLFFLCLVRNLGSYILYFLFYLWQNCWIAVPQYPCPSLG